MYISCLRRFFGLVPRIAYRFFAWVCTGLRVLPLLQPYLLARQYKDSHFHRKTQMRKFFGDAGGFFYFCLYGQRRNYHIPDCRRRDLFGRPHGERQRVADAGADGRII